MTSAADRPALAYRSRGQNPEKGDKTMRNTEKERILSEINRTVKNCEYYKEIGNMTHFVNEAGSLRGMMYIADCFNVDYPQEKYYELYIRPAWEYLEKTEPVFYEGITY